MSPVELTELFGLLATTAGGIFAYVKWRSALTLTSAQQVLNNDANLRDDQREFIRVLQEENSNWRQQVEALRQETEALRREIESLRSELAFESRAREAQEARYAAEKQARMILNPASAKDEQAVSDAGDVAAQKVQGDSESDS